MDSISLIEELANKRQQVTEFIAPVIGAGVISIHENGIPLKIRILDDLVGWYKFVNRDLVAIQCGPASPIERQKWLMRAKKISVIVGPLLEKKTNTRIAINLHTFEPIPISLCSGVELFDTTTVAVAGNYFFNGLYYSADSARIKEHLKTAVSNKAEKLPNFRGVTPAHKIVYEITREWLIKNDPNWFSQEDRLRQMARAANAEISVRDNGNDWTITIVTAKKQRTTAIIGKNFMTKTAGFCVSDDDHKLSFQSLISVLDNRR